MMPQEGVDYAVLGGHGAGVRAGRPLATQGAAGFQHQQRQVALARDRGSLGQQVRVVDRFQIQQQQLHLEVLRDLQRQFGDGNVGLVAGGVAVAYADAALMQQAVDQLRQRTALADDGRGARNIRKVVEDGGEVGDRAAAEIGQPLRIGADDAHAAGARARQHRVLDFLAVRAGFTEAGSHDHRHLHAHAGALLHRLHRALARERDDRHLRHFGQRAQIGIRGVALHLGAPRIHRKHLAAVAVFLHEQDRPAADFMRIVGGADHGDGRRFECSVQIAGHGLAHSADAGGESEGGIRRPQRRFRRPVHQHDAGADQQRRAEECRGQRLAEQDDAEGDAEQRREKREHRQPAGEIARQQPEPGKVAGEGDD